MNGIIKYAIENKCSDIHITEGKCGKIRKRGGIVPLSDFDPVSSTDFDTFIKQYIPNIPDCRKTLGEKDIDTSFYFDGKRLRANIYLSKSGVNMALRILNDTIPTMEELHLPQELERFVIMESGLVLVIGTTGSGKSTTLASIMNEINRTRNVNIITIEDPIEYVYQEIKARIEQREIGTHIDSFQSAVRSAMRQDPDILLVGELRDLETISNAITLAETGHLVFGTLHAKSVADTVDRIIDVFEPQAQEQIRVQLASVLRGVIHQRLVPDTVGGRIPLIELLMVDDVISSMIKQHQKANALRDYMRSKKDIGCIHLVDNIVDHCKDGNLDYTTVKNILSVEDYSLVRSILTNGQGKRERGYGI